MKAPNLFVALLALVVADAATGSRWALLTREASSLPGRAGLFLLGLAVMAALSLLSARTLARLARLQARRRARRALRQLPSASMELAPALERDEARAA